MYMVEGHVEMKRKNKRKRKECDGNTGGECGSADDNDSD